MRTVVLGEPRPAHRIYHQVAQQALLACEAEMRPGRTAGDIFGAHARILDEHGLSRHRLNACGYSLGAKFTPSWMDWPMFYEGNPWVIEPGMVLFAHMILMDSDTATAMCLGSDLHHRRDHRRTHHHAVARPRSPLIAYLSAAPSAAHRSCIRTLQ